MCGSSLPGSGFRSASRVERGESVPRGRSPHDGARSHSIRRRVVHRPPTERDPSPLPPFREQGSASRGAPSTALASRPRASGQKEKNTPTRVRLGQSYRDVGPWLRAFRLPHHPCGSYVLHEGWVRRAGGRGCPGCPADAERESSRFATRLSYCGSNVFRACDPMPPRPESQPAAPAAMRGKRASQKRFRDPPRGRRAPVGSS